MAAFIVILAIFITIAIIVGSFFLIRFIIRLFIAILYSVAVLSKRNMEEEAEYEALKAAAKKERAELEKRIGDEHYKAEIERIFKRSK